MDATYLYDVFLSHSSKDKATVRPLADRLRNDGVKVWFDEWVLKPGDSIPAKVEEGLERSRVLLLCMSANAFGSDWAGLEAGTFRFRDPLNRERRFVPLRLDDAPIKGSLAQFLYINWLQKDREHEYPRILEACLIPTRPSELGEPEQSFQAAALSLGHTAGVLSVAWNPDGRCALSGSADNTVRLWDLETGRCLRVLERHTDSVLSVAWSPDGHRALSGSADNTVRLWDLETGRCLRVLGRHTDSVLSVAWSPDGRYALSGSADKTARLWEIETGHCLRTLEGHTDSVLSVAWSPDGHRALSGSADKTARLWEIETGHCLRMLEGHGADVWSMAWSPDGHRVLSGSADNTVRLWEIETGRALRVLEDHNAGVWSVAWSPDGHRALSGSADNTVRLWDLETGRCLRVLESHTDSVLSVAWSPDGHRALSGSSDSAVRLWDVETGRCLRVLEGHGAHVWRMAWSPDGHRALSGSSDKTIRLWDVETGHCLRVLEGHGADVWSMAWSPDGHRALSGSSDKTIRLWDLETGHCLRVLRDHGANVLSVAWSPDGHCALSGSSDNAVRLWDVETGRCLLLLAGHTDRVFSVAWGPDGHRALSGSADNVLRLWDIEARHCLRVLEGHTANVLVVAWSPDGHRALSGASDSTVRLWDIETGHCLRVLEGHTDGVLSVAWSLDGRHALSGSADKTVRLWDIETGHCLRVLEGHTDRISSVAWSPDGQRAYSGAKNGVMRVWLPDSDQNGLAASPAFVPETLPQLQYTNAKVLLVGDTNSGKTGLTERLAHGRPPHRDQSTSGTWSTQWPLKDLPQEPGWEREVWLWDFGGQADQRLIHQLYLDRTALVLLMFDSDREMVLPGLREWQQALAKSKAHGAATFLLAGRTDVGFRFDREKVCVFARESGYEYFETSAETGSGISELRQAMLEKIPWGELTRHNSPALFKRLKDEILKLRDDGLVLATFKELESVLRSRLPTENKFADAQLDAVISLLDGPGVVKELGFGSYILLRPEWINTYAQAVIRTLRAAESGLGCLPVSSIMEGKLIFQTKQADGKQVVEKRLGEADERVVLQAMEQMLLQRRLCLRQDGDLVFPSHFGLERPTGPTLPKYFASYAIRGFLDDIYASLVVKLAHCGAFKLQKLWRDAADFATLADGGIAGITLVRREDGRGELLAHHSKSVSGQEQVIFANYIHEHLREKSTEEVPRLRYYSCPECDEPVKNRELAMERLEEKGEQATILCQRCERPIPLWDALEKRFASKLLREKIGALRRQENANLDSRRLGQLLVHEVSARLKSANQNCHEIPGDEDVAIDMVVEFTDDEGYGTGKHMYLQLKAGNSHLTKRKRDGAEVFAIKSQRWVKQWIRQEGPMMLVIGTFPDESDRAPGCEKKAFAEVRWMEVGEPLKVESERGVKPVRQIVFKGDRLDAASVGFWRGEALTQLRADVPPESRERLMKWAGGAQVNLAVVFTDVVGCRGVGKKAATADWTHAKTQHFARGEAMVKKLDGFLVKKMGDGLMAVFRDAACALNFMLELSRGIGEPVVSVRQAAHFGVATPGQAAVFDQHANFTARLSGEALEGDVVVSDVFKKEIDAVSASPHRAKQWERIIGVSFRGFQGKFDLWRLRNAT